MKDIYVFDMGNVITRPANLKGMYENVNPKCSYKEFKDLFYHSGLSTKVYKGEIDDNTFFSEIKRKIETDKTVEELQKLYIESKGGIYESTLNFINKLKSENKKIYLLSNLKEIDYEYLKSVIDIDLFDKKFLSFNLNSCKPNKDIYQQVIKDIGTNNFYFFDDTEENVISAKSLGISAYHTTGDNIEEMELI